MHRVSIDRPYLVRTLLFALLLLWPLLVFGRPAYMPDSAHYQHGGEKAFAFVAKKLHIAPPDDHKAATAGETAGSGKIVARSIPYSVLGYALRGPNGTMVFLAIFHALCVAATVTALFMAMAGGSTRAFAIMTAVLIGGTSLAPVVDFIMPDIFAGVLVGALAILPFYARRFSPVLLALLLAMIILAVTLHPSHPPIAVGMVLVIAAGLLLKRWRDRKNAGVEKTRPAGLMPVLLITLPIAAGIAITLLSGIIGFGRASIAPEGYPLALARGLFNGPARWYLEEECRKDPHSYAMCEVYGTDIPSDPATFLFGPTGVVARSTPAQLARIRAEENPILIAATRRYPLQQAWVVVRDVPRQFFYFTLNYVNYDSEMVRGPDGQYELAKVPGAGPEPRIPALIQLLSVLSVAVVAASAALLIRRWRGLTYEQRGVVLALLVGLLANAAVCAIFSGISQRYQARVIWLVPLVAVAFARNWRKDDPTQGEREVT